MKKRIWSIKQEYEKKLIKEANKNMKTNREDMREIIIKKCKKDIYKREVLNCNK